MNVMFTVACVILILLHAADEEERSHIISTEARALWPGHCGSTTEGEFSHMANSEHLYSSSELCRQYH